MLFDYARDELSKKRMRKNILSFDDLLLLLHRSLKDDYEKGLAQGISAKFKAALVDEFQDTDPIQYAIFRNIFYSEKGGVVFLIGDPKQAIYGFRGADLFSYIQATRDVENIYTLNENWRSEPCLINATNTIFSRRKQPFLYDEIPFHPSRPGSVSAKRNEPLSIDGKQSSPLKLWFVSSSGLPFPKKPVSKGWAREFILNGVASEIAWLCELGKTNRAMLGKSPLQPRDIAVLVRTNDEAQAACEHISSFNIPNVLYSDKNLFDSHEARELQQLLLAIANPKSEPLLKGALVTDFMGLKSDQIYHLLDGTSDLEGLPTRFRYYNDLAVRYGPSLPLKRLIFEEKILDRLIRLPAGERRVTNTLHLLEVINQVSVEKNLTTAGVVKWLKSQIAPGGQRLKEHQIRLESDENAVSVLTIHKSKGLEYPVVFCPFMWASSKLKSGQTILFHNQADNMAITLDLGSSEKDRHKKLAEEELLAENIRLLYVALTRAKNRCYMVWGRFNQAETSAPAYLLHSPSSGIDVPSFPELSDQKLLHDLSLLAKASLQTIEVCSIENSPTKSIENSPRHATPEKPQTLEARLFSANIDKEWRISSFSSIISGQPQHIEAAADYDKPAQGEFPDMEEELEESLLKDKKDIFSFPRGTRAGICLHSIFQELDFIKHNAEDFQLIVSEKLSASGFDISWEPVISGMIQKTLYAPLDSDVPDLTLSRIPQEKRINELQFYFPLKRTSGNDLSELFSEQLEFSPAKGFMKGFIDMVFQFQDKFYIVDWKSNFLGGGIKNYCQASLAAAMQAHYYTIQYYLYTLALHQYLRLRLHDYSYEKNFGGAYYIFLRGVDPSMGPEYGIFRGRPPKDFIAKLSESLIYV
ncbi:MAG: exodeoxyribonuclease V subunit beta [Pseudomonadota bacterium]